MKIKKVFIFCIISILLLVTGCNNRTNITTNEAEIFGLFSKEELLQDADRLMTIVKAYSAKLYTEEEELQAKYKVAINMFEDEMTSRDFMQIMKPVVAALRCGHTHIYGNVNWDKIKIMPLDVKIIDGRLYMIKSASNTKIPEGSEIISINGRNSEKILERILNGTSADGYNETGKISFISRLFSREYMFNIEYVNDFEIEYITPDGKSGRESVSAMSADRVRSKLWRSSTDLYASEINDNYSVLTVNTFNPSSRNTIEDFNEFFDKYFLEIKEKGIENIILDVRGNSGGDPIISSHLFSYLEKEEQPYWASDAPNYYSGLKDDIPMAENHFNGNLYILIDGGCFSSNTHLLSLLKYQDRGIFIGEETGGHFVCTDSSKDQTLPNTELNFHYSTQVWAVAVEGMKPGRGIMPDYDIKMTVEDYLNDSDPVMSFALNLISN